MDSLFYPHHSDSYPIWVLFVRLHVTNYACVRDVLLAIIDNLIFCYKNIVFVPSTLPGIP